MIKSAKSWLEEQHKRIFLMFLSSSNVNIVIFFLVPQKDCVQEIESYKVFFLIIKKWLIILVWFCLVLFYGILTIVGYLRPNPVFSYLSNIYDFCRFTELNDQFYF